MLGCVLVLWVGSTVAVQEILGGRGDQFQKPLFITLFNSVCGVSLLAPDAARLLGHRLAGRACTAPRSAARDSASGGRERWGMVQMIRLSATLNPLWLCSACIYNLSLLHTSIATNTVLSSSSSVFTLLFSVLICRDPLRPLSCLAAAGSCAGCVLVALQMPLPLGATVRNTFLGEVQALLSAAIFAPPAVFALASVLLRRLGPPCLDAERLLGVNGLVSLCVGPPLLCAAHWCGVEQLGLPAPRTLRLLVANAMLGTVLANYLYTSALFLLTPLAASVCLSLSIPLSALVDQVVLREHRFSTGWAAGAALVCSSVLFAALDLPAEPAGEAGVLRGQELATVAESQGLLEADADCDDAPGPSSGDDHGKNLECSWRSRAEGRLAGLDDL